MHLPSYSKVIVLIGLAAFGLSAAAQYKWTGPDGRVVYSDSPPPPGVAAATIAGPPLAKTDSRSNLAGLAPIAAKYPVVLYTTSDCSPCQQARSYLNARGIPFAERTVKSSADVDAFRAAGFSEVRFPTLSVGRERNTGFESSQWDSLLDAAGYPAKSMLPAGYRNSPAQSMAPASGTATTARPGDSTASQASSGNAGAAEAMSGIIEPRSPIQPPRAAAPQSPPSTIRF
jgi:glutaredoxin